MKNILPFLLLLIIGCSSNEDDGQKKLVYSLERTYTTRDFKFRATEENVIVVYGEGSIGNITEEIYNRIFLADYEIYINGFKCPKNENGGYSDKDMLIFFYVGEFDTQYTISLAFNEYYNFQDWYLGYRFNEYLQMEYGDRHVVLEFWK